MRLFLSLFFWKQVGKNLFLFYIFSNFKNFPSLFCQNKPLSGSSPPSPRCLLSKREYESLGRKFFKLLISNINEKKAKTLFIQKTLFSLMCCYC